jgi:biopolymer transport protein ExbD
MTPMIDMVFQLIAFFMILLNFSEAEQDQRIHLPTSELARPPDHPPDEPRTIQLMNDGKVLFAGQTVTVGPQLERLLRTESQILERTGEKSPAAVTMIIRADAEAKSGEVQRIIELCQKSGFEKFTLRARQQSAPKN